MKQSKGKANETIELKSLRRKVKGLAKARLQRGSAEKALRESERRYQRLWDSTLEAIAIHDKGKILEVNRAFCWMFAYDRAEIIGKMATELAAPEYRDQLKRRMTSGSRSQFEVVALKKDGTRVAVELVGRPTNYHGRVVQLVAIRDISERKHAEEKIQLQSSLLDQIGNPAIATDLGGKITYWNKSAERFFGWKATEVLGKKGTDIVVPTHSESFVRDIRTRVDRAGIWEGEIEIQRKDGTTAPMHVSSTLLRDPSGKAFGRIGSLIDLSEHKKAEEALKSSFSLLQATLESTDDGILVVDNENRISSYNRRFLELWHIPESIMVARDDNQAIQYVLDQLKEPEVFLTKVRELYAHPDAESFDVLEFKDGRIFERYSQPQRIEEKSVGRVWSFRDITKRKRGEEGLRESEANLRKAQEIARLGSWTYEMTGRISWSDEMYRIYGVSPQTFILNPETSINLIHPDDQPVMQAWINACAAGGKPGELEFRIILPDGAIRFISGRGELLYDGEGKPIHMSGTAQDITERKLTLHDLKNSEERFRSVWENSLEGMRITDKEGTIVAVNDAYCQLVGQMKDELEGKSLNIPYRSSEEENQRAIKVYKERFANRSFVPKQEAVLDLKSGKSTSVEISNAFLESNGNELLMLSIFRDVTERAFAEEKLSRSEDRYRDLVEHCRDLICTHDLAGNILSANGTASQLLGYNADEIIGMNLRTILAPESKRKFDIYIRELSSNGSCSGEMVVLAKTGEKRYWEFNNTLRREGIAAPIVRGMAQDITEQKQTHDALKLFRELIDRTTDAIEVIDPASGRFLDFNEKACSVLGYSRDELLSLTLFDTDPTVDRASFDKLDEFSRSSGSMIVESIHRRKDGSTFPVEVNVKLIHLDRDYIVAVVRDITERKRTEFESATLAQAIKSVSECISITDVNNNILFVNEAFLKTYHYEWIELIGQNISLLHTKESPHKSVEKILVSTKMGGWEGELVNRRKDGSEFSIHLSTSPIRDDKGNITALIGVATDITERKHAERQILEAKQMYEELVESMPDIVYSTDDKGIITFISPAVERLSGYKQSDIIGRSLDNFVVPEEVSLLMENFNKVLEGAHLSYEYRMRNRFGDVRWVTISSRSIPGKGVTGILTDSTDRKLAEESIRNLHMAIEQTDEVIFMTDIKGTITYCNPAFEKVYGYAGVEVLGKTPRILKSGAYDQRYYANFWNRILAGESLRGEHLNKRKNGSLISVEYSANPVLDSDGKTKGFVVIQKDITERKKTETRVLTFSNLGEKLNTATTPRLAAMIIADASDKLFGWDAFTLDLYQPEVQKVTPVLNFDTIDGKRIEVTSSNNDLVPTARMKKCLRGQKELILRRAEDTFMDEALPFGDIHRPSMSLMYVPIRSGGKPIGILSIQSYTPSLYGQDDLETVQSLADYCGGAVERIQKVTALHESEEQLRSVWDNSVDAMRLTDSRGIIVNVNSAYCDLVKIPRERLIGSLFSVVYADGAPDNGLGEYHVHFANNSFKLRVSSPVELWNHEILEMDISTSMIELGSQAKLLLCIFRDITERKKSEEALASQTAYFERLFEDSPTGIAILDNDDQLVSINRSFERMFQFSGEEIRGRKINDCIVPAIVADEAEELSQMSQNGAPVIKETVRMRKDGTLTQVKIVGYPIRIRDRQLGIYAMYEDINERKEAEAKIAEQARLLDVAIDGIVVRDTNDKLIYWNHAAELMLGWSLQEARLIGVEKLLAKDEWIKYKEAKKIVAENGTWKGEFRQLTREGREITVESRWTMVRDRDGVPSARLIINRDVTKQKQLEMELTQIQKLESIGTLASGIAHDFNNILGIILGYSALIGRIPDDTASVSQSVEAINSAVQRGANLVKQILTFARKTEVFIGPVDANVMVKEIAKMLRQTLSKTIDFSVQLGKNIPSINADATQLHQALLNLCVNARDAMPGGGTLTLMTEIVDGSWLQNIHSEADSREYVLVKIADTGTGMDNTTRSHLFEPFFTTKEKGKGTGLGLSVVYGVMKNHNGFVDVESEPGKGTAFSLYFPVPKKNETAQSNQSDRLEIVQGGSETILVVEDEELLLAMLKIMLEAKGYRVLTATNGQMGLEIFRQHVNAISLVLSDVGLPRLGGDQLYYELKKINPSIQVILASGYFDPQMKSEIFKAGARDFIQKPYDLDDVLRKVRSALDAHGEARP